MACGRQHDAMLPLKMKHGDVDMKIYAGCITDRGNYRDKNQDRVVCRCISRKQSTLAAACVCDGIGSFEKSELAAEMVTAGITHWFEGVREYYPNVMTEEELVEDLDVTIRELNELVYDFRREKGTDIGRTMSVLLLVNRNYYIFHVGDSRIYRTKDRLCQITRDEVSMGERDGKIKPLLANYIGKSRELWLNRFNGSIEGGELFLMGSDGLYKKLTGEDVAGLGSCIKSNRRAQKACENLLERVLKRGERDNISCILLNVVSGR